MAMYHIRITKTASFSSAVQVIRYEQRRLIVAKHIGSARTPEEITALKSIAQDWIEKESKQCSLFVPEKNETSRFVSLEKSQFLGTRYSFIYQFLAQIFNRFDFQSLDCDLLTDLVLIRIIEPASLLRSAELLDELFGVKYWRMDFYRNLPHFIQWKDRVENCVLSLAKKELKFSFTLVFYDVTTLYFESFKADELRKPGFSKDGKSAQPQILIGLLVSSEGFPVAYEIYEGNKFEGHTLIPSISNFQQKHDIETLTVVADAGMISTDNIKALKDNKLSYIVGARIANLSKSTIIEINEKLAHRDKSTIRIETKHGIMVCDFSEKRYRKDKHEMEKQIAKAEKLLKEPSKAKRVKFVQNKGKANFELNKALMEKTEKLLGIKGYYTNLDKVPDQTIIARYHDLWHVEQSFRIAKSDLETRPIYHFKEDPIRVHIMICFMALAVCKYLEIKTGKSIKSTIKLFKGVTDARILNTATGEELTMQSAVPEEVKDILKKLKLPY